METKKRKKKKVNPVKYFKILLILITIPFLVYSARFYIQKNNLLKHKKELEQKIADEAQRKEGLTQELEKVGTKEYYEYLARKYLGYIYPDEKVIIVIEDEDTK